MTKGWHVSNSPLLPSDIDLDFRANVCNFATSHIPQTSSTIFGISCPTCYFCVYRFLYVYYLFFVNFSVSSARYAKLAGCMSVVEPVR